MVHHFRGRKCKKDLVIKICFKGKKRGDAEIFRQCNMKGWKVGHVNNQGLLHTNAIRKLHMTGSIYQKKGSGMTITVYTQWSAAKSRFTLSTTKMVHQLKSYYFS